MSLIESGINTFTDALSCAEWRSGILISYPNGVSAYIYFSRKENKNKLKWMISEKEINEREAMKHANTKTVS